MSVSVSRRHKIRFSLFKSSTRFQPAASSLQFSLASLSGKDLSQVSDKNRSADCLSFSIRARRSCLPQRQLDLESTIQEDGKTKMNKVGNKVPRQLERRSPGGTALPSALKTWCIFGLSSGGRDSTQGLTELAVL